LVIRWVLGVILFGAVLLTGCQSTSRKGLVGTFKIGERAQVGPLIYNVYETQYMVNLGQGADARIPKDRYLLVRLSVVNSGGATADESIPTFTLIDDAGQTFNELDTGIGVPQWLGIARKVRPAESTSGNIVFDVAPKHYRLRITDQTDEDYGLVDLPLTFGDTAPPVEAAPTSNPR